MKEILEGYKTKIAAWVTVAIPVLAMLGINLDQEVVLTFINEFHNWLAVGFTMAGGLIHYFKTFSDKKK